MRRTDGIWARHWYDSVNKSTGFQPYRPKDAPLPAPLAPMAGMASRDITIVKKKDGVTVGSKGNTAAPVIYTFRLAHQ